MKSELEKLREKQVRRRRKRTLRILAVSPLIALVFVAILSLLTRISTVIVRNPTVYSSTQICNQLSFSIGDSLFSVDRDRVAQTLSVSCPYVKDARVKYRFPNRVEVSLTPAEVALAVRTEKEVLLLDEDFKVLEVVDRLPEGVLAVDGMEIVSYTVGTPLDEVENIQTEIVRDLLTTLKSRNLYEHVSAVDLSKKYNISMRIYDVITVYLGNSEDFDAKMNMLVKILNENDVTVPAEIRVRNYSEGRYTRLPDVDSSLPSTENSSDQGEENSSTTDKKDDNS